MKKRLQKVIRYGPNIWTLLVLFMMGSFYSEAGIFVQSQERMISGKVTSADNSGLPGVTVIIAGTTEGTITDLDGNYKILVKSNTTTLKFSYIGFVSEQVVVGSKSVIDISMIEDLKTLEEVVVVGYGEQRKSDLTGAVSSVSGEDIKASITSSVDQALQGRAAGVQVTQNSGQPGGATSVKIRGATSLTTSTEPLYVVDGVQIGGGASSSAGFSWAGGSGGQNNNINPLAFINPNDIERIEILKDASATAIYGSRAANGVVIITTKRGKKGEGKIGYDGYYGVQQVYKTFDLMNLTEYAEYSNEIAQEVTSIQPNPRFQDPSLLGKGTDWQDAIYQVAPMQSHTVSFSGGSEAIKYMLSGGYFSQDGIILGSKFDRLSLRVNLDGKINDRITVGTSMSVARRDERIILQDGGDGVTSQAAQMSPLVPVRNFDGSFAGPTVQNASAQVTANPVALAILRNNTALTNRITNNLYADIKIVEGLKLRSELATDFSLLRSSAFLPTYEWGQIVNNVSQLAEVANTSSFWLLKNFATYHKSIGNHDFTFLLGLESQKSSYEGITAFKSNLPNDLPVLNQGEVSNIPNGGFDGWNSISSQFARVNYGFADRYLVTATFRRDGSSRFGPNNRWGGFPSLAVAWKVINEPFMPQSDLINDLKLRVGWGVVGNESIPNYGFGSQLISLNSEFGAAVRNGSYSNSDLKWESTRMINLGVGVELFKGKLGLEIEVYNKLTNDMLTQVSLPSTFGGQVSGPWANFGSLENKGIEISLSGRDIIEKEFKWSASANFSVNRNKVVELGGDPLIDNIYWYSGFQTAVQTHEGRPIGQYYGYVMEGIFTNAEEINNHAVQIPSDSDPSKNKIDRTTGVWLGDIKWKDLDGNGIIDTRDQTFIGDPNPDFTFGFSNNFEFKGFTLDIFLTGEIGGDAFNYSRARNEQMLNNFDNQSVAVINRAKTRLVEGGTDLTNINDVELVNPNTNIPRFDNGAENFNHFMSTRWIEDASYVRIQNVRLGYRLPSKWVEKMNISNIMIYTSLQNVATFTNYSGLDPQIGSFGQNPRLQNVDLGRYPTPRIFTIGLKVN